LKSDEEEVKKEEAKKEEPKREAKDEKRKIKAEVTVKIDWDGLEERTLSLSVPVKSYNFIMAGKKGTAFIAESAPNAPGFNIA
jgi:tricorn protease